MQALNDILNSIKGNTAARVRDPIVGTFIVSWVVCNWDKIALLIFGSAKVDERIIQMSTSISVVETPGLVLSDTSLLIAPAILTLAYLFWLPKLSIKVKGLLRDIYIEQHSQTIELDIGKSEKQKELNKANLRADPEKEFLPQELQIELNMEKDKQERRKRLLEYINKKTSAAEAKADAEKSLAENQRVELNRKKRLEEQEKLRHEESLAAHQAVLAANRFPLAYFILSLLSKSLNNDNIFLSLDALSDLVATIFGHRDFSDLLNDETFNNLNASKAEYIYHDIDTMARRIEEIALREGATPVETDYNKVFQHIYGLFDELHFNFLSGDALAEEVTRKLYEKRHSLLRSKEFLSLVGSEGVSYENIELEVIDYKFNSEFQVRLSGVAYGDSQVSDHVAVGNISLLITAECKPVLGRYGLSEFETVLELRSSAVYA